MEEERVNGRQREREREREGGRVLRALLSASGGCWSLSDIQIGTYRARVRRWREKSAPLSLSLSLSLSGRD